MRTNLENDKLVLFWEGRIDSANAGEVERQVNEAVANHPGRELVIDAEELQYISSAGLRIMMKICRNYKNPPEMINVSRDVYDILEMTGFTELYRVKKAYRRLSVDGCEVIGKGYFGTIYRLDDESIVKVYKGKDSIPMIENEIRMAKRAFLSGIPTAIAYDIVRVGEDYGSVFEMLKASTYMEWIRSCPEDRELIVDSYVKILKLVNDTVLTGETLPSAKQHFLDYLAVAGSILPQHQRERLGELIEAVPESLNAVHGDCHMNNVMRVGDEPMLIDMDTLSVGNAVFELAGVFYAYIPFSEDDPGDTMRFYGIPFETCEYIWKRTLKGYFKGVDGDALSDIENRIMLLGWLYFLYRMQTDFEGRPLSDIRTVHACEHIAELLGKVRELKV